MSFPCDPALRQRLQAQMVAKKVSEWRRMTRTMETNKPQEVEGDLKPKLKRSKSTGDTSIQNVRFKKQSAMVSNNQFSGFSPWQ